MMGNRWGGGKSKCIIYTPECPLKNQDQVDRILLLVNYYLIFLYISNLYFSVPGIERSITGLFDEIADQLPAPLPTSSSLKASFGVERQQSKVNDLRDR